MPEIEILVDDPMSKKKEKIPETELQQRLLDTLAELGGRGTTQEDIVTEGTKFVIPVGVTKSDAVTILKRSIQAEDAEMSFSRKFRYRPMDGANAFSNIVEKHFGMMLQVPSWGMFGPQPPERLTINVGPSETKQVPWGRLQLPMMPGMTIHLNSVHDVEVGQLFRMSANGPAKYRHAIEGVFKLVEHELEENSMYRGKAIDGRDEAQFLDLSGVDEAHVIYGESTRTQLDANIWSLLKYTKQQAQHGLPLKRAVLLEGPYGCGKTITAYLTAQYAVANGWTFVYCRPGEDDIELVMQTARLYQPAVVFLEDLDTVADDEGPRITRLLDLFDGINAKGTKIMMVLTTNHKEKIHKGMLRPGRLDAVISIGEIDAHGIEDMIRVEVDESVLGEIDYPAVHAAMQGYMPAFIKEVIDRAKRYSIARNEGRLEQLQTADFVGAADGLRMQQQLMDNKSDMKVPAELTEVLDRTLTAAARKAVATSVSPNYLTDTALEVLETTHSNGS